MLTSVKSLPYKICMYQRYTLESFAEIALGDQPGVLGDDDAAAKWAKSFDMVQILSVQRRLDVFASIKKLLQVAREKELSEHLRVLGGYTQSVIDKRKNTPKGKLSQRQDLLSGFIEYGIENNEPL